jgi:TPP-dependent indolepyruvate ferredoxin oxidoreductase alpha subunit
VHVEFVQNGKLWATASEMLKTNDSQVIQDDVVIQTGANKKMLKEIRLQPSARGTRFQLGITHSLATEQVLGAAQGTRTVLVAEHASEAVAA